MPVKKTALRAGILGAGLMGAWHARASLQCGGRLVAFCEPNLERAGRFQRRFGGQHFEYYSEMLSELEFDVIHVCTPADKHVPILESALQSGAGILVEKPLAPDGRQVKRLLDRAAESGTLICPVHQFVFQEGVRRALRRLPDLGRIVHLNAVIHSAGADGENDAARDRIASEILPHPLSLVQAFCPGDFNQTGWKTLHPAPGELHVRGISGALLVTIDISMNARPTLNRFIVYGEEGALDIDLFHGYSTAAGGQVSRAHKIAQPFTTALTSFSAAALNLTRRSLSREPAYPGLRSLIAAFYDAVRTAGPPPITPEDALAVYRAVDRILESR